MSTDSLSRRQLLTMGSVIAVGGTPLVARASTLAIAVVVTARSAERTLSRDQLRRIFLNKDTNGESGERFVPINQRSGSPERALFDARVLDMTPEQAARYWIDQRLRGKRAPATAGSTAMLRRALVELPGAISYLALADIDASLRVLRIDGRNPSEKDYLRG